MDKKTKIICLLGESGSGKSTVAETLEKDLGIKQIISFTTRKQRYENEPGHIFTTKKQFECNKANNSIAAETYYNGNWYWTNKGQLTGNCIYVIDIKGVEYLKERCKDKEIIVIYLKASKENRFVRMMYRDKDKDIALDRIEHDEKAFQGAENKADYIINANRPVRLVVEDVKKILKDIL